MPLLMEVSAIMCVGMYLNHKVLKVGSIFLFALKMLSLISLHEHRFEETKFFDNSVSDAIDQLTIEQFHRLLASMESNYIYFLI